MFAAHPQKWFLLSTLPLQISQWWKYHHGILHCGEYRKGRWTTATTSEVKWLLRYSSHNVQLFSYCERVLYHNNVVSIFKTSNMVTWKHKYEIACCFIFSKNNKTKSSQVQFRQDVIVIWLILNTIALWLQAIAYLPLLKSDFPQSTKDGDLKSFWSRLCSFVLIW